MKYRSPSMFALATTLMIVAPASAQDDAKKAAAQEKLDDAKRLMTEGKYQEACAQFEESRKLVAGMATQFRLAECYEKIGRLASAWSHFVEVADAAQAAELSDRERVARERAAALKPKLSYLTIQVPDSVAATPGLVIGRDGVVIERAQWGMATPVDAGEHRIIARAPGKAPWFTEVQVEGEGTKLVVSIGMLTEAQDSPDTVTPPSASNRGGGGPNPILLGVGYGSTALAVIGGIVFTVVSNGKARDAEDRIATLKFGNGEQPCRVSTLGCDETLALREDQGAFANAAAWTFIGAGALGIATTIYALAAPSSSTPAGRLRAAPVIAGGGPGIVIATDW